MNDNSLTVLGSSSGHPKADRACSGYLLKTGESLSLIDCGGGVTSSFLRRGYNPLSVDRVFISHTHPDHVSDLPLFIQLIYLESRTQSQVRTQPLDVYLPSEFVEPFKAFLPAVYLIQQKFPLEINIVGYDDGFVLESGFKITAIGNNHLRGNSELIAELGLPNRMQCHSFEMEVGEKSVFYSSDITSLDEIVPYVKDKDIAIIESTHIDIESLLSQAGELNVGRFIMSHLGTAEEVSLINSLANKAGVSNLVTAVDGLEIML